MSPADYMELARILGYKLPLAGLADLVAASARRGCSTPARSAGRSVRATACSARSFCASGAASPWTPTPRAASTCPGRLIRYQREPIASSGRPCAGGYRYANRAFGIQVELPGDEAFYDYLDALPRQARYDRRQASLILWLRRRGTRGAVRLAGEGGSRPCPGRSIRAVLPARVTAHRAGGALRKYRLFFVGGNPGPGVDSGEQKLTGQPLPNRGTLWMRGGETMEWMPILSQAIHYMEAI